MPGFCHPIDAGTHLADTSAMDYAGVITIDPARRGGKPCIRDTRITVYDVLDYLASGMAHGQILDDFPELTENDIRASLEFAGVPHQ